MENLDTGLEIVDPCPGQEAISPPAIIPMLDSPTTSRSSISQNNEDDLAHVEEIVQKYEFERGQSSRILEIYWCSKFHFDNH